MADSDPAMHDDWSGGSGRGDNSNCRGGDGSMFASTFGTISGRLHKDVKMATPSTSSSPPQSSSKSLPPDLLHATKEDCKEQETDQPSETESTTTDSSDDGLPATSEEISIMEAKVQILYGQLYDRETTIRKLKQEQFQTRQEFEIFEKESAECMEELGRDIDELKDILQERDDRIKELESLQIIPEHLDEEDLQVELENLRHQLRVKDVKIGELEERQGGSSDTLEPSQIADLQSQLEGMEQKLEEKDVTIEKLEESENLNFRLVEERNEEIERLNAKLAKMDSSLQTGEDTSLVDKDPENAWRPETKKLEADFAELEEEHQATLETLTKELEEKDVRIQELEDGQAHSANLRKILECRESQNENWRQRYELDQEQLSTRVQELTQQLCQRDSRVDELEKESRLNDDLIKDLEKLQTQGEPKDGLDESFLAEKVELETRLEECSELEQKVEVLSSEAKSDFVELNDIKAHPLTERARCEKLDGKVNSFTSDLQERDQKIAALGFATEGGLIDALHETQQRLKSKEDELKRLNRRENANKALSAINDIVVSESVLEVELSSQSRDILSDDPKSIENLLSKEKSLRQELKARVKALTRDLKNRDADDESSASSINLHKFYFHLSHQILAIVGSLSARDGISNDLIKAFQLKLEYTSSIQRQLDAREAQIELLLLELNELEQNKDNLCTSISSNGSNHTLLVSSKLEELLIDIHEREEKLKVLEWLTVDLSKTLEAQTDELDEYRERTEREEKKTQKKIDLLLNEAKDREDELQGLKKMLADEERAANKYAEVEARLASEVSEREGLQETVNSLTENLREAERKVSTLESKLTEIGKENEGKEALQAMVDSLTDHLHTAEDKVRTLKIQVEATKLEESEKVSLQTMVDSLKKNLLTAENRVKALQTQVEETRHKGETQREGLQAMVNSSTDSLQEAENKVRNLEMQVEANQNEKARRECLQNLIDALTEDLQHAENKVRALEMQIEACKHEDAQKKRLQELVSSLAQDQQDADGELARLKAEVECQKQEMSSQRTELQATIDFLTKDLQATSNQTAILEAEIESKNGFILMRETQVSSLEQSLNEERQHQLHLASKTDSLRVAFSEQEATIETVALAKEESEVRVAVLREELEQRCYEVETLVCVLTRHEQCITEMENERESSNGYMRDSEHEIAALLQDLQVKELRLGELESAQKVSTDTKERLEKQLQEASDTTSQLEQARQENVNLTKGQETQNQEFSKIIVELDLVNKHKTLERAEALEQQAQEASRTTAQLQRAEQENLKLTENLRTLREHNSKLLCDVEFKDRKLGDVVKLENQLAELEIKSGELRFELKSQEAKLEHADKVSAEYESLREEYERLQIELKDAKRASATIEKKRDELQEENGRLRALEEHQSKLESSVADHLKEQSNLHRQFNALRVEKQRTEIETSLANRSEETDTLSKELDKLRAERTTLLDDLKNRDQQLGEASKCNAQMQELKELNAKHLADLKAWEGRVNELERLVAVKDQVFQEMTVVGELLHDEKSRTQELLNEIDSLRAYLEQKDKELESVKEDREKSESASKDLKEKAHCFVQLKRHHEGLQQKCTQLEERLEMFEKLGNETKLLTERIRDYNELEGHYKEAQEECKRLGKQNEGLQELERECEAHKQECQRKQLKIDELTQKCQDYSDLERECDEKKQECNIFVEEMKSLALDLQRNKEEADKNEKAIQNSVGSNGEELQSLHAISVQKESVIKELQATCQNFAWLEGELNKKKTKCRRLEKQVEDLTQKLESTRVALAAQVTVQRSLGTDALLCDEVQNLQQEVKDLDTQVYNLSEEKALLVDQLTAMQQQRIHEEEQQLQEHQERRSQITQNMETLTQAFEEREKQVVSLQTENALKKSFVQHLQQTIDEQSNDIQGLMEEHERECSELHEKLESITGDLQATNLRLMELESEDQDNLEDMEKLQKALQKAREENKATQMEKHKVRGQLEAIGFESMDDLVRGIAAKCQEHDAMQKIIEDSNKRICTLERDLERAKETHGTHSSDFDARQNATHVQQIHKIRELEMKIGIFRDEIAGKNAIIEDLTLRLPGDGSEGHSREAGSDKSSISTKDAPGLRMKRVASPIASATKKAPLMDESASKTAKALAQIPELVKVIRERDATIVALQEEIATSKRAIEGLVKGLEYNVQEKIEADKMVHEKKTQCTQFASKVQRLSLKLKKLEANSKRPMNRNLASLDEIKALSVDELVNLLRQSRLLAEDLTDERERLIQNATSMSIALAESRGRVEELMQKLEPDSMTPTTLISSDSFML